MLIKNIKLTMNNENAFHGLFITAFLFLITLFSMPAYAAQSSDENPSSATANEYTRLTADIGGQINPEGLKLKAGGFKRWIQATGDDNSAARYTQIGFGMAVSPAYASAAIYGEWQPFIFLNLHTGYDFYKFFGTSTGLLSFPDRDAKFGDTEVKDLKGKEESTTAHRISFQPTLYAKAGPVIIINQTSLAYYRFNGQGPYFLELENDMLMKDGDYLVSNIAQLLAPLWKGTGTSVLYIGPYYEITRAWDADLMRQRAGGEIYWVIEQNKWNIGKVRIYSQAGVNIRDPNRQGEIYFAIGSGADFD